MGNGDVAVAREYHEATKHSYASIRVNMHYLDWANKPPEFKEYPELPPLPLPGRFPEPATPTLESLTRNTSTKEALSLADLAALLFFSGGLTKRISRGDGGYLYFRAAACAGALYPIEFYVVVGDVEGLEPGVYHFSPKEFALRQLREGDHRGPLAAAAGDDSIRYAAGIIVLTAITWRSSWKYQARSYRYHFWDAGTILANLLATGVALSLPTSVAVGFADAQVNSLVGIDGDGEVSLALVPIGRSRGGDGSTAPPTIQHTILHPSQHPVSYPIIRTIHLQSSLASGDEARAWRMGAGKGPIA